MALKMSQEFPSTSLDITHHFSEHRVTDPFYRFYRLSTARNIIFVLVPRILSMRIKSEDWGFAVGGGGGR